MSGLDLNKLRADIQTRGLKWTPLELPADSKPRGLGYEPTPPETTRAALETAQLLMLKRMAHLFPRPMALTKGAALQAPAAGAAFPRSFDWRTRGVIGAVTDQGYCGSCVSHATTGLVGAMAGVEHSNSGVQLSAADQHFCSSHGANCHGWNNGDALNEIKSRGVVSSADFPYMSAFDSPPVGDPNDIPDHLWIAHCRTVADRNKKVYKITEVSAWTGDDRKIYLANVGPLVCGYTVYEDFRDHYGGGVYRYVSGKVCGGHAVLVIGYSEDDQCWICRNSWGTGFGGAAHADGTGAGFFKIGYGECGIDNEAFFGAQGVIAPASSRWGGWWPVAGGVAAPGTSVFGVSRSLDKLDIFCAGTDHGTYTAAWQAGDTSWRGWWPVAGGVAAPGTSVFGVSRSHDKLDIFCVGTDHGTYTAAWQAGDTSWRGWWRVRGGIAAPNTSITAVSRNTDKLDIFCVGSDHRIFTAAWQAGDTSWRGWWPVAGGVAAPGTSVFGVSRGPDKLDIFCVGTDMQVYTAAWHAGDTSWRGWWPVGHFKVAPGTSVYPVSRSLDKIDIFAVGQDGGIYSAAWQAGDTSWRGWWRILGGASAPLTSVTAVVRSPDHLDVFAVGTDYHIYTAAWQP